MQLQSSNQHMMMKKKLVYDTQNDEEIHQE